MEMMKNILQYLSSASSCTFAIIWGIGILIFVYLEIGTQGLTSIWYAFGCLLSCIFAYSGASIFVQLFVFIITSTLCVILTRPLAKKYVNGKIQKTNTDRLIGQTAIVKETINNKKGQGLARINGMDWSARAKENDEVILKGKAVEIVDIQGVKLIVKLKK